MDLAELLARIPNLTDVSDEELGQIETDLLAAYETARGEGATAETVETLTEIADAVDAVRTEAGSRLEAAEALAAQIAEIDARLASDEDEGEGETEGETEETEGDDAEAEAEAPEAEAIPEPIAASGDEARPVRTRPRAALRELAHRNRPVAAPAPTSSVVTGTEILAASDVPGYSAGTRLPDHRAIAEAFCNKFDALAAGGATAGRIPVARVRAEFAEGRMLSDGDSAFATMDKVRKVTDPDAIVAAGGNCAPVEPYYPIASISEAHRPVVGGLPGFNATRGGIRFVTPPKLSSVLANQSNAAITSITEAEDAASDSKTVQTFTCQGENTVEVGAQAARSRFGEFGRRFYPEQVEAWLTLVASQHARVAENALLSSIETQSTLTSAGAAVLGAARDLIRQIQVTADRYRARHRMQQNRQLRVLLPDWIIGLMRIDLIAQSPGDNTIIVAEELIVRSLEQANVSVSFYADGPAAIQAAQSAGSLGDYPGNVKWHLFHEGAFLFLDGGTLDLGMYRDSTLVAANQVEFFIETFEEVAFVGVEALTVVSTLCADGTTSAPQSITPCGSIAS